MMKPMPAGTACHGATALRQRHVGAPTEGNGYEYFVGAVRDAVPALRCCIRDCSEEGRNHVCRSRQKLAAGMVSFLISLYAVSMPAVAMTDWGLAAGVSAIVFVPA